MARAPVRLDLDPDRCDRCGACVERCEPGALKIGPSYIYVDWRSCSECYACVEACPRGAIRRRESSRRTAEKTSPTPARRRPAAPVSASRSRRAADGGPAGAWTLWEAAAVLAVVLVAFVSKDAVLRIEAVTSLAPSALVSIRVVVLTLFYGLQIGVMTFLTRRRGMSFAGAFSLGRLGTSWRTKLGSAGLVLVLLVGARAAAWTYGVIAQTLGYDPPTRLSTDLTSVFGPDAVGLALAVALVVLVGPFVEEAVFRGVLLNAFEQRSGIRVAIFAQAALFALYHFTPWMIVPTFILGLATGWIAHTRESLWPAVALHASYNAIPVSIAFWLAWTAG